MIKDDYDLKHYLNNKSSLIKKTLSFIKFNKKKSPWFSWKDEITILLAGIIRKSLLLKRICPGSKQKKSLGHIKIEKVTESILINCRRPWGRNDTGGRWRHRNIFYSHDIRAMKMDRQDMFFRRHWNEVSSAVILFELARRNNSNKTFDALSSILYLKDLIKI